MHLLGLIGNPLGHSRSPELFSQIFRREGVTDWEYRLFPLQNIKDLPGLLEKRTELRGINVTIPYKTEIIPYLDEISAEALEVGAVNTVSIRRNGSHYSLIGYNTDVFGFEELLLSAGAEKSEKALVLGSGGSAKAVCYVLVQYNIPYTIVSRNPQLDQISYEAMDTLTIKTNNLIINTTPQGMHPYIDECPPIPFEYVSPNHTIIDLVYNPEDTLLMKKATNQGASVFNGMLMLQKQAEKAWEFFKQ
ncbi:MAG: shikimate dehydrogenase [Bacteroidetes bacterium]|nr:shikimate dehydrogenase [Bacteroidota bacterium]